MAQHFNNNGAVADLHSKILDAPPPPGVQILSISCSFWEILAKSYVGAPLWGVGAPSSGKSWIRHCGGNGLNISSIRYNFRFGDLLPTSIPANIKLRDCSFS